MKTIGLIGGMSWESSKVYYEYLNRMVNERLGGSHSAKILMSSVDFAEIEKLSFAGDWDAIGAIMAEHAKKLETAGAEMVMLGTNTIHLVSDFITQAIDLPFVHIATTTGEAIQKKGLKRVGLLGTKFTMEKDFYTKILEIDFGLEIVVPSEEERQLLQDIIYNELVKGIFAEASKDKCLGIIKKLKQSGAEGIVLGCTELPLLIPGNEVDLPTFDTTKIHSQKSVDLALA